MTQYKYNFISGNSGISFFRINPPTQLEGYLIVACDLIQGVQALCNLHNISPRACALIAAHALECALKAFLLHKGKKDKSHNLVNLWAMAYEEKDLSIPKEPPAWVKILSSGHGPNFYFRYQEGKQKTPVHGGQTPALNDMAVELKNLIEMVKLVVTN